MPTFVATPPTGSLPPDLTPADAALVLANLGFLSRPDLPDRPGPAYLLVALRRTPTLEHYDPERVEYWVTMAGRGRPAALTYSSRLPATTELSWGRLKIVDRLGASNDYLTFGGQLLAEDVDDTRVVVVSSPAPILRRGGHSQGWDHAAECLGAFFGRLLLAVDVIPGFEARLSAASVLARYAAFVGDLTDRYLHNAALLAGYSDLWRLMRAEARRLRATAPDDWGTGDVLRRLANLG